MPTVRIRSAVLLLLLTTLAGSGCMRGGSPEEDLGTRPYVPLPDAEPQTVGLFMAQYAKSLKQWHQLKLTAKKEQDLRRLHAIERSLQKRSNERLEQLLDEIVQGNPGNRQTAAMALGFSADERALSPLLNALNDSNPQVVRNALTGLGLLARPETPTGVLTQLLVNHPDPWTRNNAAFALQCIVSARPSDQRDPELASECRDALIDEEPGVRAQCASVLGILRDPEAIKPLSDLLYDEVNLVSAAAATSLSHIGRYEMKSKGQAARELVDSLDRLDEKRREVILRELALLSERHYGEKTEDWREWAARLP